MATQHLVAERNNQLNALARRPAHTRRAPRAGRADLRAWFSRRLPRVNARGASAGGGAMISACLPDVSPR
jgi:hypothetical protein